MSQCVVSRCLVVILLGALTIVTFIAVNLRREVQGVAAQGVAAAVPVVVASKDLRRLGQVGDNPEDFFKTVRYLEGDEPLGSFRKVSELKGRKVQRNLVAGQPVTSRDVDPDFSPGTRELEPGFKAMTLRTRWCIEHPSPGSRVDVYTAVQTDEGKIEAQAVLKNIKTLTVGTLSELTDNARPMSVTLMLRPEDIEKLFTLSERTILSDRCAERQPGV